MEIVPDIEQEYYEETPGRILETVRGTAERPRLSVYRSNTHIYAQVIDDDAGHTLVAASSLEDSIQEGGDDRTPTEVSRAVGEHLAEKAREEGIDRVVFDRNGYRYHGRVKALANGAREGGLQF